MQNYFKLISNSVNINEVPNIIKILPFGHVNSQKGNFEVDEESFRLMKEHMNSRGIDVVIDYEHQTLEDVQAPAGGWIKELYLQDEAIAAKVEWTKTAEAYLKKKEYRYLSPVVLVRENDKKAIVLHSVALTNTPAINGMFPIINSTSNILGWESNRNANLNSDTLPRICELLGLKIEELIKYND